MLEVQICLYALSMGLISGYFIYSLALYVKADTLFAVFSLLFFVTCMIHSFATVFGPEKLRTYVSIRLER